MQILRRVILGLTLIAAVTNFSGCAVAQPVPGPYGAGTPAAAPSDVPTDWQQDLGPYGNWTSLPNYGTVWQPNVAAGWQPYTYGSWAWGPGGWTWYSTEPFGFTFHYGRWAWSSLGWVWAPGFVWGPAWVNWYWGGGFVGWAPIGFFSAVPFAQFVFISDHDFNCHNVHDVHHHHPNGWGGFHHGAPSPSHIQQVAHDPIVRVSASQLPNRTIPGRHPGMQRAQSPGGSPGTTTMAPRGPQGATPQNQGRPSGGNRQQAALPGRGQNPQSFAPHPQSGSDNPRPPATPGNSLQGRSPYAVPHSPSATPQAMRPQQGYRGYPGYGAYPGVPQGAPRAMQPQPGMAPRAGAPGMAPQSPSMQGAPRAPSTQSAPGMRSMGPSAPMAPSMPSGSGMAAPGMAAPAPSAPSMAPSAPAPSFMGGGRGFGGFGGGRGGGGMR